MISPSLLARAKVVLVVLEVKITCLCLKIKHKHSVTEDRFDQLRLSEAYRIVGKLHDCQSDILDSQVERGMRHFLGLLLCWVFHHFPVSYEHTFDVRY